MEKYVQPFIDTCVNVFDEFAGLKIIPKPPYFADKDEEKSNWDVSGIIGLSGEAQGAVSVSMKMDFAKFITKILLGDETVDDFENMIVDTVGELINIIAGNVKKELEDMYTLVISLPTIIQGKDHATSYPNSGNRIICIPFVVNEKYTFVLTVVLKASK